MVIDDYSVVIAVSSIFGSLIITSSIIYSVLGIIGTRRMISNMKKIKKAHKK